MLAVSSHVYIFYILSLSEVVSSSKAGILSVLFTVLFLVLRKVLALRVMTKNVGFEAGLPEFKFHSDVLKFATSLPLFSDLVTWSATSWKGSVETKPSCMQGFLY